AAADRQRDRAVWNHIRAADGIARHLDAPCRSLRTRLAADAFDDAVHEAPERPRDEYSQDQDKGEPEHIVCAWAPPPRDAITSGFVRVLFARRGLRIPCCRMRRTEAVERTLGALGLRASRRHVHDLLPHPGRAFEILLAEREHDALIEERLGVFR